MFFVQKRFLTFFRSSYRYGAAAPFFPEAFREVAFPRFFLDFDPPIGTAPSNLTYTFFHAVVHTFFTLRSPVIT